MKEHNKLVTFDYEGASISFRQGDVVMVNATQMARCFNKRPVEWLRTQAAQDYIAALTEVQKCTSTDLVAVTKGGADNGVTWMHRNAALEFARWLSPMFGIWCNEKILSIMQNGDVTPAEKPIKRSKPLSRTRVEAFDAFVQLAASRFSLDAVSQQKMYNKFAEDNDIPKIDYVKTADGRDSLTNLLKKHGISMSAQEFNKLLVNSGYIERMNIQKKNGKTAHYYSVTEKGKAYGDNYQDEHDPKRTQPLWYEHQFDSLIASVGIK